MSRLFTIGETLAVLSSTRTGPSRHGRSFELGFAGSESNVAIGAARLGVGSKWVGRVGNDELGMAVVAGVRGEGVDTSGAVIDDAAPTALMLKERRTADLARVVYYRARSAGSRLGPGDVSGSDIGQADLTHLTGITAALSETAREAAFFAAHAAKQAGRAVSFDVNYRSALWTRAEASEVLGQFAKLADVVFVSEEDLDLLVDAPDANSGAPAVAALGPTEVVITRGRQGAIAWIEGTLVSQPALAVTAVDPVGAGDAFAAGYLAGRLLGSTPEQRLRQASVAAAFVVGAQGDWEGFPLASELHLLDLPHGHVRR